MSTSIRQKGTAGFFYTVTGRALILMSFSPLLLEKRASLSDFLFFSNLFDSCISLVSLTLGVPP